MRLLILSENNTKKVRCRYANPLNYAPHDHQDREFSASLRFDRQNAFPFPILIELLCNLIDTLQYASFLSSGRLRLFPSGMSGCSNATDVYVKTYLPKSIELTQVNIKLLSGSDGKNSSDAFVIKEDDGILPTTYFFLHFFQSPGQVAYLKFISPSTSEQSFTSIQSTNLLEFICYLYPLKTHIGTQFFFFSTTPNLNFNNVCQTVHFRRCLHHGPRFRLYPL